MNLPRIARRPGILGFASGLVLTLLLPARVLFTPPAAPPDDTAGSGTRYACPMMDFIGNRPGSCPVCGMDMQPVTAGDLNREQRRRMGIQTIRVAEGPARTSVRAYGIADYDHRYTQVVIPRIAGRIVKRYDSTFGCCADVEAGAPIVDLYSPDVIAAQGELLAAQNMGDRNLLASLRRRFELWNLAHVAEAVEKDRVIHDVITVFSPSAGQVLLSDFERVNDALEVGRQVMADTPLLRLIDPDKRVLVVQAPESSVRFLRERQAVTLADDDRGALPGLHAVVDRISREINTANRSRDVRIYVEGARDILPPGSLVSARIEGALGPDLEPADPDDASSWGRFPLLPKTAVLSTGVRNVAWRVAERRDDGTIRFEIAPLALGPRFEDENGNDVYLVRAGLKPGDEVATQGAFLIDSQAQLAGTPSLLHPLGATASAPHAH